MYSEKETNDIVETYKANPTPETVKILAEKYSKSTKSIIGKLSREGVYVKQVYKSKSGESPVTKKELVMQIAKALDIDINRLEGLDKAPKQVLKLIAESPQ